jgi:dihydrofolate reductase
MGRKTWESLPNKFRPLPGRRNIVVTRNAAYRAEGADVAASLPAAVALAASGEAFVIGGAELYDAALPLADRLCLTEIDKEYAGDTHFPAIDPARWREASRDTHRDESGLGYAFVTYERR